MQFSRTISEILIYSELIFLLLIAETNTLHKFMKKEYKSLLAMFNWLDFEIKFNISKML